VIYVICVPAQTLSVLCSIANFLFQNCESWAVYILLLQLENVLLDDNFNAKLSDFGFASYIDADNQLTGILHELDIESVLIISLTL